MPIFFQMPIFFTSPPWHHPAATGVGERRRRRRQCWSPGGLLLGGRRRSRKLLGSTMLVVAGQTKKEPPSPLAHPNPITFSPGRSLQLPRLRPLPGSNHSLPLILLLLLCGQCPNPGPPYPCGVCNTNVRGLSYQCNGCQKWVHARCSGLAGALQYVFGIWRCSACTSVRAPTPPPATPPCPPSPLSPLLSLTDVSGFMDLTLREE